MSYHILHILTHGGSLRKKSGKLIYRHANGDEKEAPLEDVRVVVVAARGIVWTDQLIGSLLSQQTVILHCDDKFCPVGITSPLERVIDPGIMDHQTSGLPIGREIWRELLAAKIQNQVSVLRELQAHYPYLEETLRLHLEKPDSPLNESACARYYWREYFNRLGFKTLRRREDREHPLNMMLNYAYAVLLSLCHRSVVVHGLLPGFGIHHRARYRSHAFVYDVMEPLRPVIDLQLFRYLEQEEEGEPIAKVQAWVKRSGFLWEEVELPYRNYRLKLIDAVDRYIAGVASAFQKLSLKPLWLPKIHP